jgi:hypothetical protein
MSVDPLRDVIALLASYLIRSPEMNAVIDTGINHVLRHIGEATVCACLLLGLRVFARDRKGHFILPKIQREYTRYRSSNAVGTRGIFWIVRGVQERLP